MFQCMAINTCRGTALLYVIIGVRAEFFKFPSGRRNRSALEHFPGEFNEGMGQDGRETRGLE